MRIQYDHGPCPKCESTLARHLGEGRFACKGIGCATEFTGRRRQRSRLQPRRKAFGERAEHHIEHYGALGQIARSMPCLVVGCQRRRVEIAHVKSRGAGHGAWIVTENGRLVGNLVPLCMEHHREQHTRGVETFTAEHELHVRGLLFDAYPTTLADAARHVGLYAQHRGVDPRTNSWRTA